MLYHRSAPLFEILSIYANIYSVNHLCQYTLIFFLIDNDIKIQHIADADADAVTPSSNTRRYTRRSVPSSIGRSFSFQSFLPNNVLFVFYWSYLTPPERYLAMKHTTQSCSDINLTLTWKCKTCE